MHSIVDLKMAVATAQQKLEFLEVLLKPSI